MLKEFSEFLKKFNVIPAAVGLVLALAILPVMERVVDLIMQVIGLIAGNDDPGSFLEKLRIGGEVVGEKPIEGTDKMVDVVEGGILYGPFLSSLVTFALIAFAVFMIVKALNKAGQDTTAAPTPDQALLTEIRDALQK